jgi:ACR3 family arsenite transporter
MDHGAWIQPILIILSAFVGLALGIFTGFGDSSSILIEPFLMVMLFFVFLSVDMKKLKESFSNYRFTISALIINFIWTPIFAVILGILFFGDSLDIRIGILMLLVTPCTDWYLVFTAISKGNVPLSSSILPLNLVIQIILLPVYLFLFIGEQISFQPLSMLTSIVFVLIVPFVLSIILKYLSSKNKTMNKAKEVLTVKSDDIQLAFLCFAIVAMFASESNVLADNLSVLFLMIIPMLTFFIVNYGISSFVSKGMHYDFDDTTSLIFTTMARNSPLSLAIAVAIFPDRPLTLLILIIGPLIELPVLSLTSHFRLRLRNRSVAVQ